MYLNKFDSSLELFFKMPLNSCNREDLEREYLYQLNTLEIQRADACYAFGHDSEEEEEFRIKIYKLYLEFNEKITILN